MLRAVMDPQTKRIVYKDDGVKGTSPALPMASNAQPGEISLPQLSVGPGSDPAPAAARAPSMSMGGMAAPNMLGSHLSGLEQQYGLPQGYLAQIRAVESSNGKNLANPNSSARGPYQIINSTRDALGLTDADRMDEFKSASAIAKMAGADAQAFQSKYGTAPSGAQLYGMHQQGRQGYFGLMGGVAPGGAAQSLNGAGGMDANGQLSVINRMYQNAKPDLPGDPSTKFGSGFGRSDTADTGEGAAPAAPATAPAAAPAKYDGGLLGLFGSDNPGADAKSLFSQGSGFMGAAKGLMGAMGGSGGGQTLKAPGIQPSAPGDDMNTPNLQLMKMLYGMGSKNPRMQLG